MDADARDLPRRPRQPHAGESFDSLARDLERAERADERLLEIAHVALDVLAVVPQVEDRVADELPGAVERRLPAPVGLGDLDLGTLGDVELDAGLRPATRGDHWRMLEQDNGLRDRPLRH